MVDGGSAGDEARSRVTHEYGPFDAEVAEEGHHVGSKVLYSIPDRWLVGVSVAALRDRNGADRFWNALEHRTV